MCAMYCAKQREQKVQEDLILQRWSASKLHKDHYYPHFTEKEIQS